MSPLRLVAHIKLYECLCDIHVNIHSSESEVILVHGICLFKLGTAGVFQISIGFSTCKDDHWVTMTPSSGVVNIQHPKT